MGILAIQCKYMYNTQLKGKTEGGCFLFEQFQMNILIAVSVIKGLIYIPEPGPQDQCKKIKYILKIVHAYLQVSSIINQDPPGNIIQCMSFSLHDHIQP